MLDAIDTMPPEPESSKVTFLPLLKVCQPCQSAVVLTSQAVLPAIVTSIAVPVSLNVAVVPLHVRAADGLAYRQRTRAARGQAAKRDQGIRAGRHPAEVGEVDRHVAHSRQREPAA